MKNTRSNVMSNADRCSDYDSCWCQCKLCNTMNIVVYHCGIHEDNCHIDCEK